MIYFKKNIIIGIISIFFILIVPCTEAIGYDYPKNSATSAKHLHNEASYQHAWCKAKGGTEEYVNKDFTRVDCLTSENAVEFDFARKWAESIGQALYYQYMTGKKAKVVLILENPTRDMVYYNRVKELSKLYCFDTEYVTPEILHIKNGKCPYADCKCNKLSKKTHSK